MGMEQRIELFHSYHEKKGIFFSPERSHNLEQINALLAQGWRVASVSPTSSPSTNVGVVANIFALVVLEREVP